jgi:hypothetical protein
MNPKSCPDCEPGGVLNRREFLKSTALAAAAVSALPFAVNSAAAKPAPAPRESETLVTALNKTLSEEQCRAICFPFDHPLRLKVDNNWKITDKTVSEFFKPDQQEMIRQIFLDLHSPEYAERVFNQVEHDSGFGGVWKLKRGAVWHAGIGQIRVCADGPALHAALRRGLGERRGLWRADFLRARGGGFQ